ncbi:MAG: sulfurtransferase TusA family protein [Candidatus Puniceispirillales bacterium WSBS_2018_MAG_OTU23]
MMATNQKPDMYLDLKGLKCPLPVLKARRAIKDMRVGQVLEVIADDPAAMFDFPHFCEVQGHGLIKAERSTASTTLLFHIKVG